MQDVSQGQEGQDPVKAPRDASSFTHLDSDAGRRLREEFLQENAPAIVGGLRTPFVESMTTLKEHDALSMSIHTVNALIEQLRLDPADIDSLFFGAVMPDTRNPHLARQIVLDGGLPADMQLIFG